MVAIIWHIFLGQRCAIFIVSVRYTCIQTFKMTSKPVSTLKKKLEIIDEIENWSGKVNFTVIGKKFKVDRRTVSRIYEQRDKLREEGKNGNLSMKRKRHFKEEDVDAVLIMWIRSKLEQGVRINRRIIKQKATEFAIEMYSDFEPSDGWISRFIARYSLNLKKEQVEKQSSDAQTIPSHHEEKQSSDAQTISSFEQQAISLLLDQYHHVDIKMDSTDIGWQPPSEAEMKLIAARRERSDRISKSMSGYLLKGYKMLNATCQECDTILMQDKEGTRFCISCTELDSDVAKDDPVVNRSAAVSAAKEIEMANATSSTSSSKDVHPKSGATSMPYMVELQDGDRARQAKAGSVPSSNGHSLHSRDSGQKSSQNLSMTSIDVQSWAGATEESPRSDAGRQTALTRNRDSGLPCPTSARISAERDLSGSSDCVDELNKKISWATMELKDSCSVEYSINLCHLIEAASKAISAFRQANSPDSHV